MRTRRVACCCVAASALLALAAVACGGNTQTEEAHNGDDAGAAHVPDAAISGDARTTRDARSVRDAAGDIDEQPDSGEPLPDASPPTGPGVLLFAGYGEAPLNDTWLWNGSTWTELDDGENAATSPIVRSDQSMIGYGAGVLLFGGEGLGPELADTWIWNGRWAQQKVPGPSAREGAAVGVLNGKVILFGGEGSGGSFLTDTWQWDGTAWTELKITGPTNRSGASMAPLGDKLVLFGSLFDTNTWLFDGTAWSMSNAPGPAGDPGGLSGSRSYQTMATLGDKVVLFGGEQDANHILNDTWTFDGTAWTQVMVAHPPPERFHAGMTTFDGKILLYGGAGAIPEEPGFLGDTWQWDGTTWTEVATDGPSARYGYTLAVWSSQ